MIAYIEIRCPRLNKVRCYQRKVRFTFEHAAYVKIGKRLIFLDDPPAGVYWRALNFKAPASFIGDDDGGTRTH